MKASKKLWFGLGVMIVLSPLGLILPALFHSGAAWGEWSKEEVRQQVGRTAFQPCHHPAGSYQLGYARNSRPSPDSFRSHRYGWLVDYP